VDFGTGPYWSIRRPRNHADPAVRYDALPQPPHVCGVGLGSNSGDLAACHRNAFLFFGGVTQRVILDNLKAAILKACHVDPECKKL